MSLNFDDRDNYKLIKIQGFLDNKTEDSKELVDYLGTPEYQIKNHHVFDLSSVEYINSAVLGEFIRFLATCQECAKRVLLVNPSPSVAGVMELTGISRILPIVESEEAAAAFIEHKNPRKVNTEDIDYDTLSEEIENIIRTGGGSDTACDNTQLGKIIGEDD